MRYLTKKMIVIVRITFKVLVPLINHVKKRKDLEYTRNTLIGDDNLN